MLKNIKHFWIVAVIVTLFCGAFYSTGMMGNTRMNREKALIIGLQNGYPPFELSDADGNIIGFDIDVANLIAKNLNKKLIIQEMEFEALIPALKQGKVDLIMSGLNITPSRLEEIAMIPYHGATTDSLRLLFWKEIPNGVKALRDLVGLPNGIISVETGTVCETILEAHSDLKCKKFRGVFDPLMDVKDGNSIAMLVEPDVAEYLQGRYPEIKSLRIALKPDEKIMGFGIGVKKSHALLVHQVIQAIDALKASGQLEQLENKWFKGN